MDFKKFKKSQKKLKEAITKLAQTPANSYADERFWNLTKDSVGNANAIIRFCPQQDPDEAPILLTFRHGFQIQGKWFIEECPNTIGEKCPVCEHSSAIWNSNEKEARKFWRAKSYIGNILVIKDETNPENEGKVFLYKFGKTIYDKIMDRCAPEDVDEEGVNIFDFDEGLDFKLKMIQKGGYNNYDKSAFLFKSSAISDGDEKKQEKVFKSIIELKEFIDPERFKSYDALLKKLTSFTSAKLVPSIDAEMKKEVKKEEKKEAESFDSSDEDIEDSDADDDIDFDALLAD